jgi:hypothetical protein
MPQSEMISRTPGYVQQCRVLLCSHARSTASAADWCVARSYSIRSSPQIRASVHKNTLTSHTEGSTRTRSSKTGLLDVLRNVVGRIRKQFWHVRERTWTFFGDQHHHTTACDGAVKRVSLGYTTDQGIHEYVERRRLDSIFFGEDAWITERLVRGCELELRTPHRDHTP